MGTDSAGKKEAAATPRLALVVIRSADLQRAESFYAALGFVFAREKHGAGPEHLVCRLGSVVFEIYPLKKEGDATSGVRLGFAVPSLERVIEAASAAGGKVLSPPEESPSGRRAVLADPDGHHVELTLLGGGHEAARDAGLGERSVSGDATKKSSLSEDQIKILNLIAEHQLEQERVQAAERDMSGRLLRKKVAPATLDQMGIAKLLRDRNPGNTITVNQISPHWARRTRIYPDDRYELTIWGWISSRHGNRIRQFLDGALGVFRRLDDERPEFKTYSWDDLKADVVVLEEAELAVMQLIWRYLRWPIGGTGDQWAIPVGIENLLKMKDHRELLRERWLSEAQGDLDYQAAIKRVQSGLPFLEEDMLREFEYLDKFAVALDVGIPPNVEIHQHVHGDVVGAKFATDIKNSTIGGVGVGAHGRVKGTVRSRLADPRTKPNRPKPGTESAKRTPPEARSRFDGFIGMAKEWYNSTRRKGKP